jgi:hypothetical protein
VKSQKYLLWLRWAIVFGVLSNLLSNRSNGYTKDPASLWPPLLIIGAWTLFYFSGPLISAVTQNGWLYKLYRYRSPARDGGRLSHPPLSPGLLERLYLHISPPKWCRKMDDPLMLVYRDQGKLLREGMIALGVLVQANAALFKKGAANNAPANVLYMAEWEVDDPVQRLAEVAGKIYSLKDSEPDDAEERKLAGMVSYERGRDFRVSVPPSLAEGLDATYTTIMIHRKHLPYGYLSGGYFPLLIHQESRAAMILPARYWPDEMISDWTP